MELGQAEGCVTREIISANVTRGFCRPKSPASNPTELQASTGPRPATHENETIVTEPG
jgi:hypothetical protein